MPNAASPPGAASAATVHVEFEFIRGGGSSVRAIEVPLGQPIKVALRSLGQAAEGCAVLDGDRPLPLDTPIREAGRFTVLPTFSGG